MAQIQTVQGKIVCKIWLLDNSYKTVLVEPTSTVQVSVVASASEGAMLDTLVSQDVCLMMAEKLAFIDPMDDSLCFSLHECQDEVTSETPPRLTAAWPCSLSACVVQLSAL